MSDDSALLTSFWLMVFLQTMGSVDMPGSGDRKMPAPRAYLATIAIWGTLHVAADAGFGRAAKATAWVIVLAGLVLGPFGTKLVGLLTKLTTVYASQPPQEPGASNVGATPGVFDTARGPATYKPPTRLRTTTSGVTVSP